MNDYIDYLLLLLRGDLPPSLFSDKQFVRLSPIVQAVLLLKEKGEEPPYDVERVRTIACKKFTANSGHEKLLDQVSEATPDRVVLEVVQQRLIMEKLVQEATAQLASGAYNPLRLEQYLSSAQSTVAPYVHSVQKPNEAVGMVEFLTRSGIMELDQVIGGFGAELWIVSARVKTGKAVKKGTKVLTTKGWCPVDSLIAGMAVIGSDGKPTKVVHTVQWANQQMYELAFDDGAICVVGEHHDWLTSRRGWREYQVRETGYMARNQAKTKKNGYTQRWRIPCPAPVELPPLQTALPIRPAHMAALLADGGFTESMLTLTMLPEELDTLLSGVEHRRSQKPNNKAASASISWSHSLGIAVEQYGLRGKRSHEKWIPTPYLEGSVAERMEFLQTYITTDGWTNPRGGFELYTTSPQMRDGLRSLILSLGGMVSIHTKEGRYKNSKGDIVHCKQAFTLGGYIPGDTKKKTLGRTIVKFKKLKEKQTAYCITVAANDGLFVMDDYLLTHNSHFLLNVTARQPATVRTLYITVADYGQHAINYILNTIDPRTYQTKSKSLFIADMTGFDATVLDVETCLKKYRPRLCIVDRAEKLKPLRTADTTRMGVGETFDVLRQYARKYQCAMITDAQYSSYGADLVRQGRGMSSEFMSEDRTQRQGVMDGWIGLERLHGQEGLPANGWRLWLEGRRPGKLPDTVIVPTTQYGVITSPIGGRNG
jgi:hypothetical protein